jgi:NADPH-dependent 2,4-dienoyl-CoA reductase/sulfur reductase-like enzyme
VKQLSVDVLVIGSGPAGLAAAWQARQSGAKRVVIIERNREAGGILPQCIHNGFGTQILGQDLTGPEYAGHWLKQAAQAGVELLLRTMVLSIGPGPSVIASGDGHLIEIRAHALVLAMGCRERPRGALRIPGTRPAGIYTAGTAQRLVNIEGLMPGRRFVILGSGDIGMIMARRLTLEGASVIAMAEVLPYVSGLRRNLVQCVHDFAIPLHLSTTITEIRGKERVESVVLSAVGNNWQPIPGSQREVGCDTLLLSAGLIPENELSRMAGAQLDPSTGGPLIDEYHATSVPGLFAAGNVVHVYDLVDAVSSSALRAGRFAAQYALGGVQLGGDLIALATGDNVRYIVPQHIHRPGSAGAMITLEFRVRQPWEQPVLVQVVAGSRVLVSKRLRYVRPSEMVSLNLGTEQLDRLGTIGELKVQVIRAEKQASQDEQYNE